MAADIQKLDLVDIDLNSGNIHRSWMKQSIGLTDVKANAFGVRVFRDGEAVQLTTISVQGYFRDSHGNNIGITNGNTVSGNVAYVVLPAACYNYEGQFVLAIKLVGGGITGTVRIVDGMVDNTHTGGAITPAPSVATYDEVLAGFTQAMAVIEASVRYDIPQSSKTATEKAQARANIDAVSTTDAVRYDGAQTNTDLRKATARANINAAHVADIAEVYSSGKSGGHSAGDLVLDPVNKTLYRLKNNVPAGTEWSASLGDKVNLSDELIGRTSELKSAITNLDTDIHSLTKHIFNVWEQGTINYNTGEEASSTTICRTVGYYTPSENYMVLISNPNNQTIGLRTYESDGTYVNGEDISSKTEIYCTTNKKYRLICASTGTPSNVTATFIGPNDDSFPAIKETLAKNQQELDGIIDVIDIYDTPVSSEDITRINNKNFTSNHSLQDKTGWSILWYSVQDTGVYRVESSQSSQLQICVFSSTTLSSATYRRNLSLIDGSNSICTGTVNAGECIAVTAWSTDFTITIQKKTSEEYDIPQINEKIAEEENNIFKTGWAHFPTENFSRHEWTSYGGTSSREYRVKYNNIVTFPRDTYLRAQKGFYCEVYKTGNVFEGPTCVILLKANVSYRINIRRINENQSEIADIDTFANALEYSTPLAGIERFSDTMVDVSMFERIGIGGDSYASGGGIISGVTELTWGKNLSRQAGIIADIYARSGESIHASSGWNYDNENGLPALLAGDECGLYWLAHGINSYDSVEKIGTPTDMGSNPKPYTFYGQYVYAIEAIKAQFPRAKIVLATVTGSSMSLYQTIYAQINTAIKNIAEYCEIPVIDLADDDFYWSLLYEDNIRSNHPTAMLNAGMAMANRRLLSKAIIENPSYFVGYGDKYKTAISCPMVTGGTISASPNFAENGATVTLSNTPDSGYHFVRYDSTDITITDGTFTVPGTSGTPGHGTYTIYGVFETN